MFHRGVLVSMNACLMLVISQSKMHPPWLMTVDGKSADDLTAESLPSGVTCLETSALTQVQNQSQSKVCLPLQVLSLAHGLSHSFADQESQAPSPATAVLDLGLSSPAETTKSDAGERWPVGRSCKEPSGHVDTTTTITINAATIIEDEAQLPAMCGSQRGSQGKARAEPVPLNAVITPALCGTTRLGPEEDHVKIIHDTITNADQFPGANDEKEEATEWLRDPDDDVISMFAPSSEEEEKPEVMSLTLRFSQTTNL